jgi:hypothetical protein
MTKPEKQNEADLLIEEMSKGSASTAPQIPYLVINIDSEDAEGNTVPARTFNIKGTAEYSKEVTIRPVRFVQKLIAMKQDGKTWKTTNETVFYSFPEQPLDARGGISCGRLMGKAIPDSWSEEQRRANKAKANFYGFLFGLVEFPGKAPELVNFRVPAGKAKQLADAMQALAAHGKPQWYKLKLTLKKDDKNKSSPHPVLDISLDISQKLPTEGLTPHLLATNEYVKSHNDRILTQHKNAVTARRSLVDDTALVQAIEVDGSDEIPF